MTLRAVLAMIVAALAVLFSPQVASAGGCSSQASGAGNYFYAAGNCATPEHPHVPAHVQESTDFSPALSPVLPTPNANIGACGAAATVNPLACAAPAAQAAAARAPQVTPGLVLQAFQRIPVPHLRSQTQPDNQTLVNFDTSI